ncbi:MAG TPA: hypothetical protein VF646_05175, partial [Cytophagales bacterium]
MNKFNKYVTIGIGSFILLCALLSGLFSIFNKAEPETILVPKGYEGVVVVIFDQQEGAPAKYEGKDRVYEIPEDGVLLTRFAWDTG